MYKFGKRSRQRLKGVDSRLLNVLNQLVDKGNTIVIIEHNLDVIKQVDHIIDIGPEGGKNGGTLIDSGSPKEIIANNKGYTAKYLSKELI